MKRLSTVLERIDERVPGIDLPLLSVSQTRGVIRRSEISDKPPRAESLDVYKVCRKGDLVFNKMSVRAGAIGVAREDGLITYHYEVMRSRQADARYLVYLMKSEWFISELVRRERGIGAGDQSAAVRTTEVPFKVLRTIMVPLPDAQAQRTIADFLDRETAQVDALIAKQGQLIATLRERRASAIDNVLAEFPVVSRRFKHVVQGMRQGQSPQCYSWPADGVTTWAVLKTGCVNGGQFRAAENKELPPEIAPDLSSVVRRGEVIIARANTRELVGSAAVVAGDYPRLLLSDKLYSMDFDTDRVLPEFAALVLGSSRWRDLIEMGATGASFSMQNISRADILMLPFPEVGVADQRRAVETISEQTSKIDVLIAKAERFIELSNERRAALITAGVMGQIDVSVSSGTVGVA